MLRNLVLLTTLLAPAFAQDPGAPSTEALPEPPPPPSTLPTATPMAPTADPAPADPGPTEPAAARRPTPAPDYQRSRRMAWLALGAVPAQGSLPHSRNRSWIPLAAIGGGVELNDNFTVFGEIGHSRTNESLFLSGAEIAYRAVSWELLAGARGQIVVDDIAVPFATVAVGPALSMVALDGKPVGVRDASDRRGAGVGLAGRATVGLELMLPVEGSIRPTLLAEFGAGGITGHDVQTRDIEGVAHPIGRIRLGPWTARLGAGLRF